MSRGSMHSRLYAAVLAVLALLTVREAKAQSYLLVSSYDYNTDSGLVLRYNATTGALIDTFIPKGANGLADATGMLIGKNGDLYLNNLGNDHGILRSGVQRYNVNTGAFVDNFVLDASGGLFDSYKSVVGPDGNLYITSAQRNASPVKRYDGTTGAYLGDFVAAGSGGIGFSSDVKFGPDGNLYVCDAANNRIVRYNGVTGALMGDFVTAGSGGLNGASLMTFGPDGNLYLSSYYNSEVLRYNGTTGAFMNVFSTGATSAEELGFGPDGNLCVAQDAASGKILRFNGTTGSYIDNFTSAYGTNAVWDFLFVDSPASSTPEPGAYAMISAILAPTTMLLRMRRKRLQAV